jgi:P27 family predicted phage terminase small subunit
LKIARGNPGHRPIADDEPAPPAACDLAVPEILQDDADARAEWESKAALFHGLGLLTELDRDALTLYCSAFSRWKQAERQLRKHGLVVRVRKNPYPILSPYLIISNQAQKQCRALLLEFGLTPVSRTRVHVSKAPAPDAKHDRFFGPQLVPPRGTRRRLY